MDRDAATLITPHLDAGERLIWAERPDPLALALAETFPILVAGLGALALATTGLLFGEPAPGSGHPFLATSHALATPFGLGGLALVAIPVYRWYVALGTVYGLTTERAVILAHFPQRTLFSITSKRIAFIARRERGRGLADILFAERALPGGPPGMMRYRREGFIGVRQGTGVERLLKERFLAPGQGR